jgi:uncharacterized damage-inducible protein DinB
MFLHLRPNPYTLPMSTPAFDADLEAALAAITDARAGLISLIQRLDEASLDRARRGGWTVRRIIEHVIESEWLYARGVALLRGLPLSQPGDPPQADCAGRPIDEIICLLDSSRSALLRALESVTEDEFYDLRRLGREEYSILSILENAANHDREHTEQIASVLRS